MHFNWLMEIGSCLLVEVLFSCLSSKKLPFGGKNQGNYQSAYTPPLQLEAKSTLGLRCQTFRTTSCHKYFNNTPAKLMRIDY